MVRPVSPPGEGLLTCIIDEFNALDADSSADITRDTIINYYDGLRDTWRQQEEAWIEECNMRAMARQLARYNRDHGKEYNPADLDDSEPPLVPPGAEIPISQVTTPQDEAPQGGASRGGVVAGTSTGPARKSKGKGKQKAAPHDNDEYQDEPQDDGAQEGQSSKRGKKTGGTRAPAQADTTDAAPKRSKINTWDFPHELDRSKLGQYILGLEELEKLVDADGKLSSADVWRFIGIHGLDPAVLPRINKVRTGHAYVVTFY